MIDTTSDDQDVGIICMPTKGHAESHVPGSTRVLASCGHEVWLSPETAVVARRYEAKLFCIPCAVARFGARQIVENGAYTQSQLREMPPEMRDWVTRNFSEVPE